MPQPCVTSIVLCFQRFARDSEPLSGIGANLSEADDSGEEQDGDGGEDSEGELDPGVFGVSAVHVAAPQCGKWFRFRGVSVADA